MKLQHTQANERMISPESSVLIYEPFQHHSISWSLVNYLKPSFHSEKRVETLQFVILKSQCGQSHSFSN